MAPAVAANDVEINNLENTLEAAMLLTSSTKLYATTTYKVRKL